MNDVIVTTPRERLVIRQGEATTRVHVDNVGLDVNIREAVSTVEVVNHWTQVEVTEERDAVVTRGPGVQGPPGPVGGSGPVGPAGPSGRGGTRFYGEGPPVLIVGAQVGDEYLDTLTLDLYFLD